MCQLEVLATTVATQAETLGNALHRAEGATSSCNGHPPSMDSTGEEARNQLLTALHQLEQLVLGPKDTIQSYYFKVK